MAALYHALCDARDEVNARVAPLQAELDKACARTQEARQVEMALAAEIERTWGPSWPALKRRIANLARMLGKISPRA
jgi:uncharacterized coiled-coil DUF342 family protein